MDRFVNEQNIGRYRKLLSGTITASERTDCSRCWPRKWLSSLSYRRSELKAP
jgi:hypothetical protein